MSLSTSITEDIERVAGERQAAWAAGDGERAESLKRKLEDLYEQKRHERAAHGGEKARKKAVKKAMVEKELERLMTGSA